MLNHSDQLCATVVDKKLRGEKLDDIERAHLAACKSCLAELIDKLDDSREKMATNGLQNSSKNGDSAQMRPEVQKVLEHAREVFAREFGISIFEK